ncbi:hypothetical protein JW916_00020 [Candidatus Sumerlaeota bacterium]|nr:hypothetical protein [Candidatus Sumerlaeota bacterium]
MKRSTPSCEEIRNRIDEAAPSELVLRADQSPLREHLADCADCRERLAKSAALDRTLDEWRTPEPRENIAAGVMARIAQSERALRRHAPPERFLDRLAALLGYRFRVPAFASLLFLLVLGASLSLNVVQVAQISDRDRAVLVAHDSSGQATVKGADLARSRSTPVLVHPTPAQLAQAIPIDASQSSHQAAFDQVLDLRERLATPMIVLILGAPPFQGFAPATRPRHPEALLVSTEKENQL